jgi:hypothetical protein
VAIKAFEIGYGANYLRAVAKIVDHADVLLESYRYPAERWIHLRTTNLIECTFATVPLPTKITKGPRVSRRRSGDGLQSLLALVILEGPMVRTGLACLVRKVLDEALVVSGVVFGGKRYDRGAMTQLMHWPKNPTLMGLGCSSAIRLSTVSAVCAPSGPRPSKRCCPGKVHPLTPSAETSMRAVKGGVQFNSRLPCVIAPRRLPVSSATSTTSLSGPSLLRHPRTLDPGLISEPRSGTD